MIEYFEDAGSVIVSEREREPESELELAFEVDKGNREFEMGRVGGRG